MALILGRQKKKMVVIYKTLNEKSRFRKNDTDHLLGNDYHPRTSKEDNTYCSDSHNISTTVSVSF